ncbi:hypothetical protein BsWGS_07047 [Bradybaena similaris]
MLVSAVSILLPVLANALSIRLPVLDNASCPTKAYWELFNILDKDGDDRVSWPEADRLYHAADLDNNLRIDLIELTAAGLLIAPSLVGHVKDIFVFLDFNQDGLLTPADIKRDFDLIDTNEDNFKDRPEFRRHVKIYCSGRENSCPPQTYSCTFCGKECSGRYDQK